MTAPRKGGAWLAWSGTTPGCYGTSLDFCQVMTSPELGFVVALITLTLQQGITRKEGGMLIGERPPKLNEWLGDSLASSSAVRSVLLGGDRVGGQSQL